MAKRGVGIRYTTDSVRVIVLERDDAGMRIAELAMGVDGLTSDVEQSISIGNAVLVFGLGPGDFISSMIPADQAGEKELRDLLKWDIERRLLGSIDDYAIDYATVGTKGYAFAGRRRLISGKTRDRAGVLVDVEPVALLNGCEASGELTGSVCLLIALEPEGITGVVVRDGIPVALESVPFPDDDIHEALATADTDKLEAISEEMKDRLADAIEACALRLASADGAAVTPERLVLAGVGALVSGVAERIQANIGIDVTISNPFTVVPYTGDDTRIANLGAMFTTCFGLALRALES